MLLRARSRAAGSAFHQGTLENRRGNPTRIPSRVRSPPPKRSPTDRKSRRRNLACALDPIDDLRLLELQPLHARPGDRVLELVDLVGVARLLRLVHRPRTSSTPRPVSLPWRSPTTSGDEV